MSEGNVEEFVRQGYERFNREKVTAQDLWHSDGEFINAREDPDHAVYRGYDAIAKQNAGWFEAYPDLRVDPVEVRANGNRAFAWVHFSGHARTTGIPLDMELSQIWTIEGGKIRRIEEYFDRAEGLEAAGLSE